MKSKQKDKRKRPAPPAGGIYAFGFVLLAIAAVTSLLLGLQHLAGLSLPGCGEGSPCAEAAASIWGKVPGLGWPASHVGLAYFVAMIAAWSVCRFGVPTALRLLIRVGALVSVGFVIVMLVEGHLCWYCVATHVCNLGFWLISEKTPKAFTGAGRVFALGAATFILATGVLGITERRERGRAEAKAEEKLSESVGELTERAARPSATDPSPIGTVRTDGTGAEEPVSASAGFTGRYRLGPEQAAIRVVVFSDFQCEECKRIEGDIKALFEQRDDMSVSIKHFPMCSDCNRRTSRKVHPNACWAARAAEAAGILRGNDGFWEMHHRLFERGGSFTAAELRALLAELNYDRVEFERIMSSAETLSLVKADIEEAVGLGVWFTPTIYINGVELRGWEAPRAVERAITALAATNPPPASATNDEPPPALEKLIGDWGAARLVSIPAGPDFRRQGPENAAVQVVVFGDFLNPGTVKADEAIRDALAGRDDVSYAFHYMPLNEECNPAVRVKANYPYACRAAAAAESAGRLAGSDGYWGMHARLFERQAELNDLVIREIAAELGIDAGALLAEMETDKVQQAVIQDAKRGRSLGAKAIPTVFVNGRAIPRLELDERSIIPEVIAEAAGE